MAPALGARTSMMSAQFDSPTTVVITRNTYGEILSTAGSSETIGTAFAKD